MIVNTADEGGGAERMSMAVLDGFAELGLETWLLVGNKKTDHPRVVPLYLSPFIDYRPYQAEPRQTLLATRRRAERWLGLEDFNHPYSHRILDLTGSAPDLVLCHNLHGGYFDLRALPVLSRRVPVALRLFDPWLLIGHRADALADLRRPTGCDTSPGLKQPPAITRINSWRKRRVLRGARLFASAESQWMLDHARKSLLAPMVSDWRLIPGGVDLDAFSPGPQAAAREELGLDPGARIVLFVANLGPENPLKDFATVRRAMVELGRRAPEKRIELLAVGSDGPEERIAPGIVLRRLGYIRSVARLVNFYRAANVYVHAAVNETFGLSVAEALACGTPVVAASSGGVLEIIDNGRTAVAVPPGDAAALAGAIESVLDNPSLGAAMGAAAVASARANLDRRTMMRALHAWCAGIHAAWTSGGASKAGVRVGL